MDILQALLLIGLAVVPAFILIEYFLKHDIHDKEPERLIWKVFRWGMLIVAIAGFAEVWIEDALIEYVTDPLLYIIFFAALLPGVVEEGLKYWVVKTKIYDDPNFNEPMDGIMYTVVASLGFAALENIFYLFSESGFAGGLVLGVLRGALSVPAHAMFSGIMGYYIGQAKFFTNTKNREKVCACKGLLYAILLHATFNFTVSVFEPLTGLALAAALLLAMFFFLRRKIRILQAEPYLKK